MGGQRIRVSLVVASLDRGGAETQVAELARRLDGRDFDVSVALLTHHGQMFDEARARGVRVELIRPAVPSVSSWTNWLRALVGWLAQQRPAVVHGFIFPTYLLTALAAAKVGHVAAVGAVRSLSLGYPSHFPYSWLERLANRLSVLVVGNSEAVRAAAARRDPRVARKFVVIPNGIDVDRYADGSRRRETRGALGVDEDHLLVLMVANLIHYKGHADALDAFARLRRGCPRARLILAGSGPEEARLRRMAAELGIDRDVEFLGSRDDVPALLSAADLFVLPSHEEGLPNAVLEAMAAGLPIVATDVGGVREQLDGGAGVLVPPRDPEALASALGALASAPGRRSSLGRAARERAERRFSWTATVARYAELYRGLTGKGPTQPLLAGEGGR